MQISVFFKNKKFKLLKSNGFNFKNQPIKCEYSFGKDRGKNCKIFCNVNYVPVTSAIEILVKIVSS